MLTMTNIKYIRDLFEEKGLSLRGLCQVKVGNDLFILLFYWFTCFEGQCEILILLI